MSRPRSSTHRLTRPSSDRALRLRFCRSRSSTSKARVCYLLCGSILLIDIPLTRRPFWARWLCAIDVAAVRADGPPTTEVYRRPLTARVLPSTLIAPPARRAAVSSRHIGFRPLPVRRALVSPLACFSAGATLGVVLLTGSTAVPIPPHTQDQAAKHDERPDTPKRNLHDRTVHLRSPGAPRPDDTVCLAFVHSSWIIIPNRSVAGLRTSSRFVTACSKLWAHFFRRSRLSLRSTAREERQSAGIEPHTSGQKRTGPALYG